MQQTDSANQVKMKFILLRYGWLPKSKIGEKASDAIFYVIQHADTNLIKTNLPTLKKLAKQDEAWKTHAAMMEDRLLMYRKKKQVYGTQAASNAFTKGKMVVWPIEISKKVNQRRKKAGFEMTVEENAKRLGATYNPNLELSAVTGN